MIILIKFIYTNVYGYYLLYDYNVSRFIFNVWLIFRVRNSEKFQIKFQNFFFSLLHFSYIIIHSCISNIFNSSRSNKLQS